MKISIAQMDIAWLDPDTNRHKVNSFLDKAYREKTDTIIFPEMTFTGFCMDSNKTYELCKDIISYMVNQCQEYGVSAVFGCVDKNNYRNPENQCIVISKKGEIISKYTKIHPFSFSGENKFYDSGEEVRIFNIDGLQFSTFICYDLRFPEIFQAASKLSDAIIVIANWPHKRISHWNTLLRARAIENQCYIIGCNRVGTGDNIYYSGQSAVYSPEGKKICSAYSREGIVSCEINKINVSVYRNNFDLKNDRKNELYSKLLY